MSPQLQTVREINASNAMLDSEARVAVVTAMASFLGTTAVVYQKTLFYHWNVTGPNFAELHKLFEEQYLDLQKAADDVAERIRALGYFAPGTLAEFIALSAVQEDHALPETAKKMAENLLRGHETCCVEAGQVRAAAERADDQATADMMIKRMAVHDKAAWMLRSYLC